MKKKNKNTKAELSVTSIGEQPDDCFDMVNKYGTYNIQPTSNSGNDFPKIAQGLPEKRIGKGK